MTEREDDILSFSYMFFCILFLWCTIDKIVAGKTFYVVVGVLMATLYFAMAMLHRGRAKRKREERR